MYVVIRLLVFVIVLAVKLRRKVSPPELFGTLNGNAIYRRKTFGGSLSYRVGIPFDVPVLFRLQKESGWDGFFKSIGYAKEFQTGDEHFDNRIYIASEHPALFEHLAEREDARRLVLDALESGYRRVSADGSFLWLEFAGTDVAGGPEMVRIDKLFGAFKDLGRRIRLRKDHLPFRLLIVEAIIWSIAIFGVMTYPLWGEDFAANHIDSFAVMRSGLGVAAVAFVLLLLAIRAFLGKSSRGHRVLLEGAVLLIVGLPALGIDAVSEINRNFDTSVPVRVERQIIRKFTTQSPGGRYSQRRRSYHFEYADAPTVWSSTLPKAVRVDERTYSLLSEGSRVRIDVKKGYLGFAWYDGYYK